MADDTVGADDVADVAADLAANHVSDEVDDTADVAADIAACDVVDVADDSAPTRQTTRRCRTRARRPTEAPSLCAEHDALHLRETRTRRPRRAP